MMAMLKERGIPEPPGDPEPVWRDPENPTDEELLAYNLWRIRNREYLRPYCHAEPDHDDDDLTSLVKF